MQNELDKSKEGKDFGNISPIGSNEINLNDNKKFLSPIKFSEMKKENSNQINHSPNFGKNIANKKNTEVC